jgi:DNA-binding transcriptional LysR family regulator
MKARDLGELSSFVVVAKEKSFRRAAAQLNVIPSTLSHSMRALEERLGVRLLNRTTRTVALTDAGATLLAQIAPAFEAIRVAVEGVNEARQHPRGTLRINAPRLAANMVLAPVLRRFTQEFPDVKLEIDSDDTIRDIVQAGFDAGIRTGEFIDHDMIATRVSADFRMAIVGSPGYFANNPAPHIPHDLREHRCINYRFPDGTVYRWEFEKDGAPVTVRLEGPLTVNSPDLVVSAALDGIGIAYATEDMVADHLKSGRLTRILEDWSPVFPGYYIFYPSRQVSAALRAFVGVLKKPG